MKGERCEITSGSGGFVTLWYSLTTACLHYIILPRAPHFLFLSTLSRHELRDMHPALPVQAQNCWKFTARCTPHPVRDADLSNRIRQAPSPSISHERRGLWVDGSCVNWAAWCKLKGLVILGKPDSPRCYMNTVVVPDAAVWEQKHKLSRDSLESLSVRACERPKLSTVRQRTVTFAGLWAEELID